MKIPDHTRTTAAGWMVIGSLLLAGCLGDPEAGGSFDERQAEVGPPPLQLIAPVGGAAVASVHPVFRWHPRAVARIQVCSDPACASVVAELDGKGGAASSAECLGEGSYFWRASRLHPAPGQPWSAIESFAIVLGSEPDGFRAPVGGNLLGWEAGRWQAVALADGRVLALDQAGSPEIFDPACESFAPAGAMVVARSGYRATRLADSRVLVTGGVETAGAPSAPLASTEIFDPVSETFSPGPAMTQPRQRHTATLLADGRVLVAGGYGPGGVQHDTAEVYDPGTGLFVAVGSMTVTHGDHAAVRLATGEVLVAGGLHPGSSGGGARHDAELFDPVGGTFTATGPMQGSRSDHELTLLLDGRVLVTGGQSSGVLGETFELYEPGTGTFAIAGALAGGRVGHSATRFADGRVLVAGGHLQVDFFATEITDLAVLYDPIAGDLTPTPEPMEAARARHGAAGLLDGRVLLVGGTVAPGVVPRAELFIPGAAP
jgi:hypothetical protein